MKNLEDNGKISEIYDIPITTVNKLMYEKSKIGNETGFKRIISTNFAKHLHND